MVLRWIRRNYGNAHCGLLTTTHGARVVPKLDAKTAVVPFLTPSRDFSFEETVQNKDTVAQNFGCIPWYPSLASSLYEYE